MEWNVSYSVGDANLDNDHKSIVDLINRFDYAFSVEAEDGMLAYVLDELIEFTGHHFAREETYMHAIGYPNLAFKDHQAEHEMLQTQLDEFYERFHAGDTELAEDISEFLGNWLRDHILGTDMRYKSFADKASD